MQNAINSSIQNQSSIAIRFVCHSELVAVVPVVQLDIILNSAASLGGKFENVYLTATRTLVSLSSMMFRSQWRICERKTNKRQEIN